MIGTIIRIATGQNFGWIKVEDKKDYFFHRDDFHGHWRDLVNDLGNFKKIIVEFDGEDWIKGPRAINVKRVDFPN